MIRVAVIWGILLLAAAVHSCGQVTIHVNPTPLVMDSTPVDMTLDANQGFVISASYQGGVPPFTCALIPTPLPAGQTGTPAPVPTWVKVDSSIQGNGSDTAGSCGVTADHTPYPVSDVLFIIQVTDSKGNKSSENVIVTNKPAPAPPVPAA